MKKYFLLIVCCLLIGCAGTDQGGNARIQGWILRPGGTSGLSPGSNNTEAFVYAVGASSYTGPRVYASINPDDGSFDLSINLGVSEVGPPIKYVTQASFDLYLQVNGAEWSSDTTAIKIIKAFRTSIPVEAGRTTSIGKVVLDYFVPPSIWN